MKVFQRIRQLAVPAMLLICGSTALAQAYPNKPVRVVVPYAAGGSTDSTARLVSKALSARFGQPFVVDNRPGAGGLIGQDLVAKAPGDGYTLLFSAAGPLTVTPHSYAKLPYDPLHAFKPIKLVATSPLMLITNPKLKVNNVRELIKEARNRPNQLSYGSFGNGSAAHLAGELFKSLAGLDIVHVPYKGSAPALADLLGGQIDMMFDVLVTALPHVKSGSLQGLAITSAKRSSLVPDIPTIAESGVQDFDAQTWFGLLAPKGSNKEVVEALSAALDAVVADPKFREALAAQGAEAKGGTPEQFDAFLQSEYAKWGKVAKTAGIGKQ